MNNAGPHTEDPYAEHLRILRARTDRALALCGFESLAIAAGTPSYYFLDDQPRPFRVNPHFQWWAPVAHCEGSWLVYRPGHRLRLIFLQPQDYWHKPPAALEGAWTEHFDIDVIRTADDTLQLVRDLPRCAFVGEWQATFEVCGFAARNPPGLLNRLHYTRAVKTQYEIECLKRANERAARGHEAARAAFVAGASEFEIHLAFLRTSEQTELELPYGSIVALDENCAVLHYQHQERSSGRHARSFLIDAGATHAGYAADITRTYARDEDSEYAALIGAVNALQLELCASVRAGVPYLDLQLQAHVRIAHVLRDAELIRTSAQAAVELGLSSVFFPHGIGHLLGLQVHDIGGLMQDEEGREYRRPAEHPYLRLMRPLEPGIVVTIEPGIYFIDLLLAQARSGRLAEHIDWERVERLRPFGGIRVEDDVVCTQAEPRNLTREAFASLAS